MNAQDLGEVRMRTTLPANDVKKLSLLKDVLPVFLASLLIGIMEYFLTQGAGAKTVVSVIICAVVTVLLTCLMLLFVRSGKKRQAESYLEVREKGVSGNAAINAFKTKEFAFTRGEILDVTAKKNVLSLRTAKRRIALLAENADAVAEEIRKLPS